MIRAVIMDMDGVLIDSEPLWQEAEKRVFEQVGIRLTTDMMLETMGMRVDEVVKYRYERQRWQGKSLKQVEEEILDELERLIMKKGQRQEGVDYILDFFRSRNIRLALASSSYMRVITIVLRKLEVEEAFEVIHSGEFEKHGKPHPGIYLSTLLKLGVTAREAFAIEDSYNGARSAKAAGLKTVAIPAPEFWHDSKFEMADIKLRSLQEFNDEHLQRLTQK